MKATPETGMLWRVATARMPTKWGMFQATGFKREIATSIPEVETTLAIVDPDELASELQALAGPSAGPNGGQIYVDGFTAGELPPKSAIREIRINQNPFSAEYDKLGYGRIEIFTKPGMEPVSMARS